VEYPPVDGDSHADSALFVPGTSTTGSPVRAVIAYAHGLAREQVRSRLESEPGLTVVAECQDCEQTASAIRSLRPDLVIVDIELPGVDGFQVLNAIAPGQTLVLIFTSPDQKHAIRALEARALDAPPKPLDQERLRWALARARLEAPAMGNRRINPAFRESIAVPSSNLPAAPAPQNNRLLIKARGRIVFLNQNEIDWIEAASNYVRVRAGGEWYVFRGSISRTQERLDPNYFIRIHRSTIVNVRKIKELIPVNGSEYVVVLKCGKELSCGRGHRAALQRVLDRYL